jgi:DNA-binding GntR family transcriptional regulator
MLRTPKENDTPLTVADVFIPYGVGLALSDFPQADVPIFEQIEKSGVSIVEIKQEISAAMPTEKEARTLAIAATQPVLVILRRYCGERGRLLEVTRTVHPADTFRYQMDVRLAAQRTM